jgi:hypothetical protein
MSVENIVMAETDAIPSLAEIQAKCVDFGYPIKFTYECDLRTHTGFLPVEHEGKESGFESYYVPKNSEQLTSLDPYLANSSGLMTVTGGNFREVSVALMYLNAVAQLMDGAYICPDYDVLKKPSEVKDYLDEQIESCLTEMRNEEYKAEDRAARQAKRVEDQATELAAAPPPPSAPDKPRGFLSRLFGKKD